MSQPFKIVNTEMKDLPLVVQWFNDSVAYQERKGYPTWGNFDQEAIASDIRNRIQHKAVNEQGIGIVFSAIYSDKVIWREMDKGQSIYLHRIVVNPAFKGQKLLGVVLDWAKEQVKQKNLKNIRLDTWVNNPVIIDYYKSFGFIEIEDYTTPDTEDLPRHNRNLALKLLELTP